MASLVARVNARAEVIVLTRRQDVMESINIKHRNKYHLEEFELLENITATTDPIEALNACDVIVHAIPLQSTESFLSELVQFIPSDRDVLFVSTSKGLETETLELACELLERVFYRGTNDRKMNNVKLAYLSGPTFAKQLMNETPSGAVMAARDMKLALRAASFFASDSFRVYPSDDVVGVCIGGALKNVIAILAGGLEGMGFGVNAVALLVTRGSREITRIGIAMGANATTLGGLAGIGDLMLTCLGADSRNKAVGYAISSENKSITEVLESRASTLAGVAEGVATAPAAAKLCNRLKVDAPIFQACALILEGKITTEQALHGCMTLPIHPDIPLRRKGFLKRTILGHLITACSSVLVYEFVVRGKKKLAA